MKAAIIIFPNNLFQPKLIHHDITKLTDLDINTLDVIIIEHPVFWGKRTDRSNMNFNPLKLLYHRASMYYWYNTELHNYKNIKSGLQFKPAKYISIDDYSISSCKSLLAKYDYVLYYDPCDKQLEKEIPKLTGATTKKRPVIMLDTHLFYNTLDDLSQYYHNTQKQKTDSKHQISFNHARFYKWMRERTQFLPGSKTYDTQNRNKMPVNTAVPNLPTNGFNKPEVKRALRQGTTTIEPVSYRRNVLSRLVFPIDHDTAINWLRDFCRNRLQNFGKYQDAIDSKGRGFLFHSCISPMLNIGIITPHDVIDTVNDYYSKHKNTIPISSFEGFMRQVVGWREYQRYLYHYGYNAINGTNYFQNKQRLPLTKHIENPLESQNPWYAGNTGIPPVDDAIKQAWSTGYLHHIQRLMVIGNLMNLVGVHPDDVYRWFMEFALDSYDWVMVGNVYSMAMWADAGVSMRKPYISSDAYIMKMSSYERGEWNDIWYALFYDFVRRNSKQLSSTYYAGMVKNWNKKSPEEKQELQKRAAKFIKAMTQE